MQSPSGRYGQLSFKDMIHLIGQFEQANVINVSITGGGTIHTKGSHRYYKGTGEKTYWS